MEAMSPRACLLLAVALLLACSAEPDTPVGSGGSGPGASSGTGAGPASGTGGGPDFDAGSCTDTHCSTDLHTVLDCKGNVVEVCPDDKGCSPGGGCVAPC